MTMATAPFRSGARRARVAIVALAVTMLLALLDPVTSFWQIGLIKRIEGGGDWSQQEADMSDIVTGLFALFYIGAYVVAIITFLMWFHRVRANLPALGITDARCSPRWAVGWWFIPIMNLFRPYQVTSEIWRASDPDAVPSDWRQRPTSPLLGWWWALFLIGGALDRASFRLWNQVDDKPRRIDLDILPVVDTAGAIATIAGSLLVIRIIREIDRRQDERAAVGVF